MGEADWYRITANFKLEDDLVKKLVLTIEDYAKARSLTVSAAARELLIRGLIYARMTEGIRARRGKRSSTMEKLSRRLEMARAIGDEESIKVFERDLGYFKSQIDLMRGIEDKDDQEGEPPEE